MLFIVKYPSIQRLDQRLSAFVFGMTCKAENLATLLGVLHLSVKGKWTGVDLLSSDSWTRIP
jgi:hypothetical protein